MTFEKLGLSDKTLKAIEEVGYKNPTPIQEKAVPLLLDRKDVVALAQTGSGKTASFILPLLDILSQGRAKARMPRSLIMEPTRELAAQVAEDFATYGKHYKFSVALLIGGESFGDQEKLLAKGVDVLIATPGRLLDLHERGKILLNDVKMFVIDEADRMLDMGFIPDIEKIAKLLPPHQTALFSATMPPAVQKLTEKFLKNAEQITISQPTKTATNIDQYVLRVADKEKREALRTILRKEKLSQAIVFCNRKREVDIVTSSMKRHKFKAGAFHGDLSQTERNKTLKAFKDGEIDILVASDVAARGLDVESLSAVINFHVPNSAEDYIHRIGRTGRAGKEGKAFTLVSPKEEKALKAIVSNLKKTIQTYPYGEKESPKKPPHHEKRPKDSGTHEPHQKVVGFGEEVPAFMKVKASQ